MGNYKAYYQNKKEADKKTRKKNYQEPRKTDYVKVENRPGYRPVGGGVAPGGGGVALYIASKFGAFDKKVSATRPPDQVGLNPKTKTYKMGKHESGKPTPISHKTKATSLKSGYKPKK